MSAVGFAPKGEHERWVLQMAARPGGLHPRGIPTVRWVGAMAAILRLCQTGYLRDDGVRYRCVEVLPGRYLPPPPVDGPPLPGCLYCTDEVFWRDSRWQHRWTAESHRPWPRGPIRWLGG